MMLRPSVLLLLLLLFACNPSKKFPKALKAIYVPRERCLDNVRVGKSEERNQIVILHVDLKASRCTA